jgi:3-oxoacyl-(acyl-carrier-protein) synthase
MGNLGAGSGVVEMATSIVAMQRDTLFPLLNFQSPDADCPIRPARGGEAAGASCLSVAATPQGQAAAVLLGRWNG